MKHELARMAGLLLCLVAQLPATAQEAAQEAKALKLACDSITAAHKRDFDQSQKDARKRLAWPPSQRAAALIARVKGRLLPLVKEYAASFDVLSSNLEARSKLESELWQKAQAILKQAGGKDDGSRPYFHTASCHFEDGHHFATCSCPEQSQGLCMDQTATLSLDLANGVATLAVNDEAAFDRFDPPRRSSAPAPDRVLDLMTGELSGSTVQWDQEAQATLAQRFEDYKAGAMTEADKKVCEEAKAAARGVGRVGVVQGSASKPKSRDREAGGTSSAGASRASAAEAK